MIQWYNKGDPRLEIRFFYLKELARDISRRFNVPEHMLGAKTHLESVLNRKLRLVFVEYPCLNPFLLLLEWLFSFISLEVALFLEPGHSSARNICCLNSCWNNRPWLRVGGRGTFDENSPHVSSRDLSVFIQTFLQEVLHYFIDHTARELSEAKIWILSTAVSTK